MILYALISRQKVVLAEHTSTSATGNFPTVTRVLLSKIPPTDGKMTYVYDDYVFHYVVENSICYLCMSDEQNKHRIPYAFLHDMKDRFVAHYGLDLPMKAIAFTMNEEFAPVIKSRMDYYNSSDAESSVDKIGVVKSQIEDVKDVMVENIEKVLERGEKIELLVDKTDRLNQQAFRFENTSRKLSRALWWKRARVIAFGTVIVALVIFFIVVGACGGFGFDRCKKH
mmetsp:Transcript_4071/g.5475  ORF Transcript_4071/g.5475 Transcript_4071/m.5475 type:complete len:226 (-) Transcript_4071:351-1028(-)